MYDRILARMRERIEAGEYVLTLHAEEEMDEDGLTIMDVESSIMTGEVIERQIDRVTGERKYIVRGETENAAQLIVVAAKFGATGKLVIITVYVE